MTRFVVADTGPLYAAADPDDAHHKRAREEMSQLAQQRRELFLVYPTLCEAYTLALYRLGKTVAPRWLDEVLSGVSFINPTPEDYLAAGKKLRAFADQPITLFDAVVAVVAKRMGAAIWTYDHHFDVMRSAIWR